MHLIKMLCLGTGIIGLISKRYPKSPTDYLGNFQTCSAVGKNMTGQPLDNSGPGGDKTKVHASESDSRSVVLTLERAPESPGGFVKTWAPPLELFGVDLGWSLRI